MTYRIEEYWSAWTTVDEWGRRGDMIGVFSTQEKANEAAKGRGWYGGEGNVAKVYVLELLDGNKFLLSDAVPFALNLDIDLIQLREDKKKSALAKLTPEEKKLLGLSR